MTPVSRPLLRIVRHSLLLRTMAGLVAGAMLVVGSPMTTSATTAAGPEVDTRPSATDSRDARAARALDGFPTETTAGVPRGWSPKRTRQGDLFITKDGAHVRDLRLVGGDLYIEADNVVVERVELIGGRISNLPTDTCYNNTVIKRTTIRRGDRTSDQDLQAIGDGGYTARRVALIDVAEGFRVSGSSSPYNCGPVKIVNSYARVTSPDICDDWHGDALQGYDGNHLVMRNSVLVMVTKDGCGGTAPFFYPYDQGNTSVDIDGLVVKGGGYPFRLGMPGVVRDLKIVQDSWEYGPIDVACREVSEWDAEIVRLVSGGSKARDVRNQRCNTNGGN